MKDKRFTQKYTDDVDHEAHDRMAKEKMKYDAEQFDFDVKERMKELQNEADIVNRVP